MVRPHHPELQERCECQDTIYRKVECKHQQAVRDFLQESPSWNRVATQTYARLVEGEKLTIDTSVGTALLSYQTDTRYGVSYLRIQRENAAGTKLIMPLEKLEKYVFDLYNPRIVEAFGSANPRFLLQPPTPNTQYPTPNTQLLPPNSQCPTPNSHSSVPDIEFISIDGFYDWEAFIDGRTIANIYYRSEELTQCYDVVVDGVVVHQTNSQSKAENYIRWHYKNGTLAIMFHEEFEACTIEDCDYLEERGQQFAFRINSQMVGYIWLSSDGSEYFNEFWVNGDGEKYRDWRECGLALAKSTRNDLYKEVLLVA